MAQSLAVLAVLAVYLAVGAVVLLGRLSESLERYNDRRMNRKKQQLLERRQKEQEIARKEQERRRQEEQQRIDDFRQRHPVQIVGVPDIDLLRATANELAAFIERANSYRPQFSLRYDDGFRTVQFSYPFEFFFSRENVDDNGPEPALWQATLDSLTVPSTFRKLHSIYNGFAEACEFPVKKPLLVYDRPPAPERPIVRIPAWSLKLIASHDGTEIDTRSEIPARVYAPEIAQIDAMHRTATKLKTEIKQKIEPANEAHEMMELFLANQSLKCRELNQIIDAEYEASKKRFEQRAAEELKPLRDVYKGYLLGTQQGIVDHFSLALQTLPLPLPTGFPWRVFYDQNERVLQVNQRVPLSRTSS
jgi:hypothetical protein